MADSTAQGIRVCVLGARQLIPPLLVMLSRAGECLSSCPAVQPGHNTYLPGTGWSAEAAGRGTRVARCSSVRS